MELEPKIRGRKAGRGMINVLILLVIFTIGVNVGNGRLGFDRHPPVATGLPKQLDYSSVDKVYQELKDNYDGQLTQEQLLNGLKHGLAQSTKDPYTTYFTAQEAKEFDDELNNSFSGIGAQLGQDSEGSLEVIAPIGGLPAEKAGLQAKDIITSINGATTSGLSIDEAVHKIRGPKGTPVTLQIVRNKTQALKLTITRDDITLPSVTTKTLDGNIGYIQISSFAKDTAGLTKKAAEKFHQDRVQGIVLDLRDNPGGLLNAAVDVSSLWLPEGQKVLDQKTGKTVTDTSYASGDNVLHDIPTVVLINAGSASASEITAGALHDNKAAYLVGEKSYGKGVVQDVLCITGERRADNGCPADELKVTIASWYRPNGQNINKKGITPDKTVKISDADQKAETDPQLQAAQAYLAKN